MLDESQRNAILQLAQKGFGTRRIARALKVSRGAVCHVLASGLVKVPIAQRPEKAEAYREHILELYHRCKANLVRVHEELVKTGATLSYQSLTGFCRRHEIGHTPKLPSGRYDFAPGEEMQHDTSPHKAMIGGRLRSVQTASLVLCYSRMTFVQLYPRFTRFECKVFLTDAFQYFGGACGRCMVDNTNVVRLKGTGKEMVPVPEMECFGTRFGTRFVAHEIGDANRSARVEGPFNHVDNNFLAGREFRNWDDANEQAKQWCDDLNARYSRKLLASRRELFATERVTMKPLPDFVPEVYALHLRIVDAEGYINLHNKRYSVPYQLIGRQMEAREGKQRVDVFDGPRLVASHQRLIDPEDKYSSTLPEHRPPRGQGRPSDGPPAVQVDLLLVEPALSGYVAQLTEHARGRGVRVLQRLLRMVREYPRQPLLCAVREAEQFKLFDLDRLERMILRKISHDYFVLPDDLNEPLNSSDDEENDDE